MLKKSKRFVDNRIFCKERLGLRISGGREIFDTKKLDTPLIDSAGICRGVDTIYDIRMCFTYYKEFFLAASDGDSYIEDLACYPSMRLLKHMLLNHRQLCRRYNKKVFYEHGIKKIKIWTEFYRCIMQCPYIKTSESSIMIGNSDEVLRFFTIKIQLIILNKQYEFLGLRRDSGFKESFFYETDGPESVV
jgi:hypothetical protein